MPRDPVSDSSKKGLEILEIEPTLRPTKPVYMIEYGLGFILFLYVLNYIYGRVTNGNFAQDWFDKAQSYLETQFALIGDAGEKEIVSSLAMTREADHIFTLWCSGRSNVAGMLATLKLVKRQDVFTQVHAKVRVLVDLFQRFKLISLVCRPHCWPDDIKIYSWQDGSTVSSNWSVSVA